MNICFCKSQTYAECIKYCEGQNLQIIVLLKSPQRRVQDMI